MLGGGPPRIVTLRGSAWGSYLHSLSQLFSDFFSCHPDSSSYLSKIHLKIGLRRPRTSKRRPRSTQEAHKSDPESQDEKRTEPRRYQDRLGPPTHRLPQAQPPPRGSIWESKTAPKSIPKRQKIEAKIQHEKRRPKTILDPSWGDFGSILAPSWGQF